MQYAKAREAEKVERKAYQYYISDSLFYAGQQMRLADRFSDLLEKTKNREPEKTGDQIVEEMLKKNGFKFKKGGSK